MYYCPMSVLDRIPSREWKDLFIAWVAISLAFTLIFIRMQIEVLGFLTFFAISAFTVGVGFVLHEMAHKFTAMGFGFWAEFRKDNTMLLMAVVIAALVGVVFAAPGATVIYGATISREQNGKISLAGPVTNLLLCIPFAVLFIVGGDGLPRLIGMVGFNVNAMIAFFNMLPVSVLDGKKVLAWNLPVFMGMFITTLGMLIVSLMVM